jgi:hydroxyacylglutathione hydrolase
LINDGYAFVKDIPSGQPEPPLYFATMKRVNRDGIAVTGGGPKPPRLRWDVLYERVAIVDQA